MKCDNCIHKQVCKDKPPESYPQFMINIMTDKCENYIHTAYVQPVKHGKWEEVTDYGGWGDTHYRCSVCGEEWYLEDGKPKDNNMIFCPRCGAKMDGDDTYD